MANEDRREEVRRQHYAELCAEIEKYRGMIEGMISGQFKTGQVSLETGKFVDTTEAAIADDERIINVLEGVIDRFYADLKPDHAAADEGKRPDELNASNDG